MNAFVVRLIAMGFPDLFSEVIADIIAKAPNEVFGTEVDVFGLPIDVQNVLQKALEHEGFKVERHNQYMVFWRTSLDR